MCFLLLLRMSAQIYAFCSIQLYVIFGHVCGSLFFLTFRQMYVIDVFTKGLLFVKPSLALP